MSLIYIQQNGSVGKGIKYPSNAHPNATIATSGCGVCASLMAMKNSQNFSKDLKTWAKELRNAGARVSEGTDMTKIGAYIKSKYNYSFRATTSLADLKTHINKGFKAVAHVGRKGYFSSSGHFVCVAGVTSAGKAIVLDPYQYSGKWTSTVNGIKRSKYFSYNSSTHEVQCSFDTIYADSKGNKFYLFYPNANRSFRYSANDIWTRTNSSNSSKSNTSISSTSKASGSYPSAATWRNGSTIENAYKDSNRTSKIGYIEKRESAKCYDKTGSSYGVVYSLSGTNKHKAGFVKYAGGIKRAPAGHKIWKNGSTKEIVYTDTAKRGKVGYINPRGTARCLGKIDNMYLVVYQVSGTSNQKIGFVAYSGGC